MAGRGRPRKPTALHLIEGTAKPCRTNKAEPKPPPASIVEPPEYLSKRARAAWGEIAPILAGMRVLTIADPVALGSLCDTFAEVRELRAQVAAEGYVLERETADGAPMRYGNPAVRFMADAERRLLSLLTEFGMTPASRPKVSAAPEDDNASPWAAYA